MQGDRYTDAWILDKRLSRIPGKAVSNKPFYRSVGNNGCIRYICQKQPVDSSTADQLISRPAAQGDVVLAAS